MTAIADEGLPLSIDVYNQWEHRTMLQALQGLLDSAREYVATAYNVLDEHILEKGK